MNDAEQKLVTELDEHRKCVGKTWYTQLFAKSAALIKSQAAEIERLREVVEKLPTTADGVSVVPGMKLWVHPYPIAADQAIQETTAEIVTFVDKGRPEGEVYIYGYDTETAGKKEGWGGYFDSSRLFSTREAAQAAAATKGESDG